MFFVQIIIDFLKTCMNFIQTKRPKASCKIKNLMRRFLCWRQAFTELFLLLKFQSGPAGFSQNNPCCSNISLKTFLSPKKPCLISILPKNLCLGSTALNQNPNNISYGPKYWVINDHFSPHFASGYKSLVNWKSTLNFSLQLVNVSGYFEILKKPRWSQGHGAL